MTTHVPTSADSGPRRDHGKKIAVYLVAEDAVGSLAGVLDRIPPGVREQIDQLLVYDAGSLDDTYLLGVGYKATVGDDRLSVVRGAKRGPGAHTKAAIDYCRDQGYDVVVLLHADGKYAPEIIGTMMEPVLRGERDAVFGSRFLEGAGRAGMPLHKYVMVRVLSAIEERVLRLGLTEYHCFYQVLSVPAIAELPYGLASDELVFSTELRIQMKQRGFRIGEVPVPTYSGTETNGLAGVRYAIDVLRAVGQYWLHVRGVREYPKYAITEKYVHKRSAESSHGKLMNLMERDHQRVLDVGCGAGYLAEALTIRGNRVVGVDVRRADGVEGRVEEFLQVDLDREEIPQRGDPFGVIVLADVIEHVREPERLLARCRDLLEPDGRLLVSVPNVAHWSVRLPLLLGRFSYTARGILDHSHIRFYTLASIRAGLDEAGFEIERMETTGAPFSELFPEGITGRMAALLERLATRFRRFWPGLLAYQFVFRARKRK